MNTGFGYLSDVQISPSDIKTLQINFLRSHACGVGDPIRPSVVKGMMLTKVHQFLMGNSGVSVELVKHILKFIELDLIPYTPRQGSVGASGDLAPLSHIGLALIGEGYFLQENTKVSASEVLKEHGIKPISLRAKEGLSLANGTHYMAVSAALLLEQCRKLIQASEVVAALSLDAFRGSMAAFDERVHVARNQTGQMKTAENIRKIFASGPDEIMDSHKNCGKIQDPYSYRCFAQVAGSARDALRFCEDIINRELNSATDNPLMFENLDFISGGNFHGQPIAMALDFLAIAMAEIGNISERRIEKLTIPHLSGLPAFLVKKNEGLNSGFMIAHYTASSLVADNKLHAQPASVDSIPTSANKEDHVSMGPNSVHQLERLLANLKNILSIEALAACQGIDLLAPLKPNPALQSAYEVVRKVSATLEDDRSLSEEIELLGRQIQEGQLVDAMTMLDLGDEF